MAAKQAALMQLEEQLVLQKQPSVEVSTPADAGPLSRMLAADAALRETQAAMLEIRAQLAALTARTQATPRDGGEPPAAQDSTAAALSAALQRAEEAESRAAAAAAERDALRAALLDAELELHAASAACEPAAGWQKTRPSEPTANISSSKAAAPFPATSCTST